MTIRGVFDDAYVSPNCFITGYSYGSTSQSSGTISPSPALPFSNFTVVLCSGATALSFASPQGLYAIASTVVPAVSIIGLSRFVRIINTNAGTLTITIPTGGVVTGALTLATNTFADFIVTITGPAGYTIARCGSGNYP